MRRERSFSKKIYVKVTSTIDNTGYMRPLAITWEDGRTFRIQEIRDFRPASTIADLPGDCYTVLINGQEKHLFFERMPACFPGHFGRWYVEAAAAVR